MKATVTLIVPCYNEEESLPIFYNAVCDVARQLPDYGISLCWSTTDPRMERSG